jgi:hypothetical protein
MQTFLSSLIILIAALYVLNQWLPQQFKQRFLQMFGKSLATNQSQGACGSCASCGSCGSSEEKKLVGPTKKVVFIRSR